MPGVPGDAFGSAADDYTRYHKCFPPETIDRLVEHGIGAAGQRVLDLGCGTGTIARQMAARGCSVVGLDVDARMLEAAIEMADADYVDGDWGEAPAASIGLPDAAVDAAVAGPSWHWICQVAAVSEGRAPVAPDGRLSLGGLEALTSDHS